MRFDDDNYHKGAWEHNYLVEERLGGEEPSNAEKGLRKIGSLLEMTGAIPSETDLLDVGCGNGRNGIYLADLGYSYTGIDSSAEAIRRAKERQEETGATAEFLVGSTLDLGRYFPQASFNVVLDAYCFHIFVIDRHREEHLQNVRRVLRPSGFLVLLGGHDEDAHQEHIDSFEEFCRVWNTKAEGIPAGRFTDGEWETVEEEKFYLLGRWQSMAGYCKEFTNAKFEVKYKEQFGKPSKAAFVLRKVGS